MESESTSRSSLKKKLKSRFSITGCFRNTNHPHNDIPEQPSSPTSPTDKSTHSPRDGITNKSPKLSRTLSKSHEKCRNLINKFGGGVSGGVAGRGKHMRRHTADFHYDPSSYALNFDRGDEDDNFNRFPIRNFSARLPHSPPSSAKSTSESSLTV